jgi:ABC-type antimicrobial peptide transport system permease subunit
MQEFRSQCWKTVLKSLDFSAMRPQCRAPAVRQRRREMGIRMALGATPRDIQYLVLGEGVRLIAFGVIAGSILALALAGSVESMLFLKSSRDMFTFTMVPAALTLVGVLACWAPARRSSHTDPSVALRDE